jgi:hypothetical protein
MKTYGIRCDLLIEAENVEELDKTLANMEIRIRNSNDEPVANAEILVADGGPWYVLDEEGNEIGNA